MIKRENYWGYTKEEKRKIKDCVLQVVKDYRLASGDLFDKDYVMIQSSCIIVHNGKNTLTNSKFANKLSIDVYRSDATLGRHQVKAVTDALFLNENLENPNRLYDLQV